MKLLQLQIKPKIFASMQRVCVCVVVVVVVVAACVCVG